MIKNYRQEVKEVIIEYNIDITTNADYNVKQEEEVYLSFLIFLNMLNYSNI